MWKMHDFTPQILVWFMSAFRAGDGLHTKGVVWSFWGCKPHFLDFFLQFSCPSLMMDSSTETLRGQVGAMLLRLVCHQVAWVSLRCWVVMLATASVTMLSRARAFMEVVVVSISGQTWLACFLCGGFVGWTHICIEFDLLVMGRFCNKVRLTCPWIGFPQHTCVCIARHQLLDFQWFNANTHFQHGVQAHKPKDHIKLDMVQKFQVWNQPICWEAAPS